ncbi:hydroxymyristoyl-ACP dehydratase [Parabacteroides timonensis]|uniref:hydroxymyristoyl-ACP dehydratase n=1 Tax=Parabacteroides timonensis TaxID=1871013 RepID=UPI00094E01B6|nr:hydroxymyristoyl-ACP dehydratase [Parabacteroides timonensis]
MAAISFDTPLLAGDELLELIPQRPPIVMVDRFFGMDESGSYTGLKVEASNLFCRDGQLDECGITEHIAQSAAVRVGYLSKNAGEEVPVGFIGSVDKMNYRTLPQVGDELRTTIRVEQEIFDITLISATVQVNGNPIAEGQLKIFLKKDA